MAFSFPIRISLGALLVHCVLSAAIRPVSHAWTELSSTRDIQSIFGSGTNSFDTSENWKMCVVGSGASIIYEDGVSDYTSLIMDGLAAAEEEGGGLVQFGPGIFNVSSQLQIPSRTCIIGAGMSDTTILLVDNAKGFENKTIFHSTEAERIAIRSLTVDGNRANQEENSEVSAFSFSLVNYAWLRSVRARNTRGYGFDIHGLSDKRSSYFVFEESRAENNMKDGFKIDTANYGSITGGSSKGNSGSGISVTGGSKNTVIKHNRILGNGAGSNGCGVLIERARNMRPSYGLIESNEIINSFFAGVCVNNARGIKVENSTISDTEHESSACYSFINNESSSAKGNVCQVKSGIEYAAAPPGSSADVGVPSQSFSATLYPFPSSSGPPSSAPSSAIPSPSTTPEIEDRSTSDRTCSKGIVFKDVCCPLKCGKCGGEDCGKRMPGGVCCLNKIRMDKISCKDTNAPCLLFSLEDSKTPDEKCKSGIPFASVCCPALCGTCGGIGCGARLPHGSCCLQKIRADGHNCTDTGPPCMMVSPLPSTSSTASASPSAPISLTASSSAKASVSPMASVFAIDISRSSSPPESPTGDPSCSKGIAFKDVCCPLLCGTCGGKGCGKRLRHSVCCLSKVRALKKSCNEHHAPCIIPSPADVVAADSNCSTGIAAGDVCCPKQCGTCGGEGCESRLPGGFCCIAKIRKDNQSCAKSGPPCMLAAGPSAALPPVSSAAPSPPASVRPVRRPAGGDPTCDGGIAFKDVCCPRGCGTCGGVGCGRRLGHGVCCLAKVRKENKSCADSKPPCLLFALPTPTGSDEECKTGLLQQDACCPRVCGSCGGEGCGKRLPNGACCIDRIRKGKRSCSTTGPPCFVE